jgi:protein-arginine kinase activator protein McsA
MLVRAKNYEYEQAAELRDQIRRLREKLQSPT